jgi:hypothetical protein
MDVKKTTGLGVDDFCVLIRAVAGDDRIVPPVAYFHILLPVRRFTQ